MHPTFSLPLALSPPLPVGEEKPCARCALPRESALLVCVGSKGAVGQALAAVEQTGRLGTVEGIGGVGGGLAKAVGAARIGAMVEQESDYLKLI